MDLFRVFHAALLILRCSTKNLALYVSTVILLAAPSVCNAQTISAQIFSRQDSLAKPYATVGVIGKTDAVSADEQGRFIINVSTEDSLEIMAPGYATLKYAASAIPVKIYLEPRRISLQEVSVVANKTTDTTGTAFSKTYFTQYSRKGVAFALRLKLESTRPKQLERIIIRAKHTSPSNLIRLHLYKVDEDGLPGKELLPETVLLNDYQIKRGRLQIDLRPFHLVLNDSHVFIGLEWVGNNDSTLGMSIGFTMDKTGETPCFTKATFRTDEWSDVWMPVLLQTEGLKNPVPQISVVYKY